MSNIIIKSGTFKDFFDLAYKIRHTVFVKEQNVPEEIEQDEDDEHCIHFLVYEKNDNDNENNIDAQQPIATARLDVREGVGKVGRMAVLKEHRGKKIGEQLLQAIVDFAKNGDETFKSFGLRELTLHAQTHALSFYERAGFSPYGEEFEEAGILHVAMNLKLV